MNRIGIILLIFFLACKSETPEQQFRHFIDDPKNKITQKIAVGDVQVVTRFLPESYRLLMSKQSVKEQEDNYYHFSVKLDKQLPGKLDKEKLLYLAFDIQNDFALLVNGTDSLAPVICQKIENGISGNYEYMVVFEKGDKYGDDDFTLVYNDKIFGIGTIDFVYKQKDIKKIPELKAEKTL
jgi:hypothetical protein